jgi:hypothetical protein
MVNSGEHYHRIDTPLRADTQYHLHRIESFVGLLDVMISCDKMDQETALGFIANIKQHLFKLNQSLSENRIDVM